MSFTLVRFYANKGNITCALTFVKLFVSFLSACLQEAFQGVGMVAGGLAVRLAQLRIRGNVPMPGQDCPPLGNRQLGKPLGFIAVRLFLRWVGHGVFLNVPAGCVVEKSKRKSKPRPSSGHELNGKAKGKL
jgi:hypothetical protein